MTDSLDTIWPISAHTEAKQKILQAYLQAWFPILAFQSRVIRRTASPQIRFIDAFAGPGIYSGGEPGSPIIALESALGHVHDFPVPVEFILIENDAERHSSLCTEIEKIRDRVSQTTSIILDKPICDDCSVVLSGLLEKCAIEESNFGPAFVFLDQFGYAEIPIDLIGRIMGHTQCEVFIYFNWNNLGRFLGDPAKEGPVNRAFGSDVWKTVRCLKGNERAARLRDIYKHALRTKGHTANVLDFTMRGDNGEILNWLFFCTNHIRGIEEMKKAMEKVDITGSFQFCDKDDPNQFHLLSGYSIEQLANELSTRLRGTVKSVDDVKAYVLTETPARLFKASLALLYKQDRITVDSPPPDWRKGTFADGSMNIRFV